jgi:hypothetical protein
MLAHKQIWDEISLWEKDDRLKLVDKILFSIQKPNLSIEEIWHNEAEERIRAYDRGDISSVPYKDVLAKYINND